MSNRRTFTSLCLGAVALTLTAALGRAENVSVTVSKVAELPLMGIGETLAEQTATSPQSARGGILQVGMDLWFTTYGGGDRQVGTIVSYSLITQQFTTQHSFGLQNPNDPGSARKDGYNPWKTTLTLGNDGRIYYATQYGGENVNPTGPATNGGVIGSFLPSTIRTQGVSVLWAGSTQNITDAQNLAYTTPIYIPTATGASVYFNTYGGGTADNWGTVQKLTLDLNGLVTSKTQLLALDGPTYGRQSQGGLLQVGTKLYYQTSSTAVTAGVAAKAVLVSIDTANGDAVSVVKDSWTTGGTAGGWNKPIYDPVRNALYSVTLGSATAGQGGILKLDLTTGEQSTLLNSRDGLGTNFADPILFGNSIYYVKQSNSTLWRYDLDEKTLTSINIAAYGGTASSNSGSLAKVVENGVESLYFLTGSDTAGASGTTSGALFKIAVTTVPEPGSIVMLLVGGLAVGTRRFRRASALRLP